LGFNLIELYAMSRHDEVEASSLIVEGVQDQGDPIISPERVAISQMGSYGRWLWVMAAKCGIEIVRIIREEDLGADRRRHIFPRSNFVVQLDDQSLLPGPLIEDRIYCDPGCRLGDKKRFLRYRIRPGRDLRRQRKGKHEAHACAVQESLHEGESQYLAAAVHQNLHGLLEVGDRLLAGSKHPNVLRRPCLCPT
jgi:hypothetical protein